MYVPFNFPSFTPKTKAERVQCVIQCNGHILFCSTYMSRPDQSITLHAAVALRQQSTTMGWLPSIFGSNTESSGPLQNLDPRLREFLEKESAAKLPDQAQASSASAPPSQSHQLHETSETKKDQSAVPSASLYQDGRYAHIWKKYRPLSEVESETFSESEKLAGMLEGYGKRKKIVRDAALENCVMQEEDWYKCMKSGSWEDRMQFCTSQFRTFERCQTMQTVRVPNKKEEKEAPKRICYWQNINDDMLMW